MARSRIGLINCVAVAAVMAGAPLAAQSTTNSVTPVARVPTPTPSPAPTGNAVGPPQLRDFNLNGTVTQPAAPAPVPAPTPAAASPPTPSPPAATTPRTARRPGPEASPRDRAVVPREAVIPVIETPDPSRVAPAPVGIEPGFAPSPSPAPARVDQRGPSIEPTSGFGWWPWLAALIALSLGAMVWWRRQAHNEQRYATDHAERGASIALPETVPLPAPLPVPDKKPVAARPDGIVSTRVTAPLPDGIVSSRVTAPLPDGIVSSRMTATVPDGIAPQVPAPPVGIVAAGLKPQIEFELVPVSAEADAGEGAILTVDIVVFNRGSAPARDVLVEAQLINGGPRSEAEVGQFFQRPPGTGERVALIAPMARMNFRTRLAVAGGALAPLVIEGRKLLVPLVAINAYYRGSGRDYHDSSSFLVGRGAADGGKMAPFRLDLGPRRWTDLAARLHSDGLAA